MNDSAGKTGRLRSMRLYALLTQAHCRRGWLQTARALLEGGVDAIQLREKELAGGELLERARELRELTRAHATLFIINDRPDVAMLSDADGVHLGQEDLPPEDVRELLGPEAIIGLSTHSVAQAEAAAERGADYIGVGPAFPTRTKGYETGGGSELVRELCSATSLPTVAIGGITPARAGSVIGAGAGSVAACAALCGAHDPAEAARAFRRSIEERTLQ